MNENRTDLWIARGKYRETETEKLSIWLSGVLSYDDGKSNPIEFAQMFLKGSLDFNTIIGWFKIVIFDKENKKWYLFGDNSNSQYFFYSLKTGCFSDSMLSLREILADEVTPNYSAIYELLGLGFTVGEETVINEIKRTDKDFYYIYDGKRMERKSKRLKTLRTLDRQIEIFDIIKTLKDQIEGEKLAAVCTGGTDSRAVISALNQANLDTEFVITGHDDNPDIVPAHRISEALGIELTVLNPDKKEYDWIKKGFEFTDGQYDAVLSYRHYLKAQWEKKQGIEYEFGGLAGEFYKNAFCHPFRWAAKKKDGTFYYNLLLNPGLRTQQWIGEKISGAEKNSYEERMSVALKADGEYTLLEKGNRIGFDILSWKSGQITNGYAATATKIDPLMDRQMCAYASHDNCLAHSMHRWQRKQVEKNCKKIADIPTDQGYTCSMKPLYYTRDTVKRCAFYLGRIFNRIRRKMGMGFKSKEPHFWDDDYFSARKTEAWETAIERCKIIGILEKDSSDRDIPLGKTGWIITLGMLFS